MSNYLSAKRLVQTLSLRDLLRLDDYLHDRIAIEEQPARSRKESKREVVPGSMQQSGEWTFQLEYVKCGKERCKKDRHGPYWYGYRTSGGKTVSKYFGKKLPKDAEASATTTKASKAKAATKHA